MSLAPRGRATDDFRSITCPRCGEWTTTESQDMHNQSRHGHYDSSYADQVLKSWDADPTKEPGYGRVPGRAKGVV